DAFSDPVVERSFAHTDVGHHFFDCDGPVVGEGRDMSGVVHARGSNAVERDKCTPPIRQIGWGASPSCLGLPASLNDQTARSCSMSVADAVHVSSVAAGCARRTSFLWSAFAAVASTGRSCAEEKKVYRNFSANGGGKDKKILISFARCYGTL